MEVIVIMLLLFVINVKAKDDCTTGNDCDMTGSVCEKGSCVCSAGFVANSLYTECLIVVEGYGSSCKDNIQCSTSLKSGSICSNNTCICSEEYHYFLGQCWKSADLGDSCKHNENCFVSYDFEAAICNDKKVCECSPGYYQREYSSCRRKSYNPGDSCGIALDCQFKDAVCTTDRKCSKQNSTEDTSGLILQHIGTTLLSSSKVGDNCSSSNECPKNADCNQRKICTCKEGFFLQKNNCYPELGASCSSDQDCVGKNTICRNGTHCVCKQGFVAADSNQYCDKMSRYIGWSCLRDRECGFFGPGGVCLSKKCHCDNSTHYVEDALYCWATKFVGDKCVNNEDCGGVNAMLCSKGICQCIENTHASSDKTVCRNDSTNIGDACEENLDCIFENSFCNEISHSCLCDNGYIFNNGSCVSGIGGKCNNTSECYIKNTTCLNGVCSCPKNYVGSEDYRKCLLIVHQLHGNCSESIQCEQMDGTCSGGGCLCKDKYHYVENFKCFKSRYNGETCASNGNCVIKNSICSKGVCICRPGFTSLRKGTTCSSGSHSEIPLLSVMLSLLFLLVVISE